MTKLFEANPYVVAEVGSNITDLNSAVQSIAAAKAVGADCAKFQLFSRSALFGFDGGTDEYSLPLDWLPKLKEKADACGIDFACTAFSPELVAAVDPFVPWHKVASSDATWPQLLRAVASTSKPVVLSTGAKSMGDIQGAIDVIARTSIHTPIVLLYCVAAYPARTVNIFHMTALAKTFNRRVGFSDHTRDIVWAPLSAATAGAVMIEKHFTAFPELDSPDRPHSLTPDEFKTMVDVLRGGFRMAIGPTPEERDMLLRHNRRLIATDDVPFGEVLRYGENFGAYRSLVDDTRGLTPLAYAAVNGKAATKTIKRGEAIGPGDFA